jgi:hypothetical protein
MRKRRKQPKRGFIRGLWGIHDESHRIKKRRFQTDSDIAKLIKNNYNEEFIVYTYGKENHKFLMKTGFRSILIHDEPFKWDLIKFQYRHKLELFKYAIEEDKYDEYVFLDWDCFPTKRLFPDYWKELGKREVFQANLTRYKASKCYWREDRDSRHYLPNAGYVYIRDKSLPDKFIEAWGEMKKNKQSAEPPLAKVIDDMSGGWQGLDYYLNRFEPVECKLKRRAPFNQIKDDKLSCFLHTAGGRTKVENEEK